jgi:hypothetical protein
VAVGLDALANLEPSAEHPAAHEHILDHLFGFFGRADVAAGEGAEWVLVALEESDEGGLVSLAHPREENTIRGGHLSSAMVGTSQGGHDAGTRERGQPLKRGRLSL